MGFVQSTFKGSTLSSGPRAEVAHLDFAGQTCQGAISRSPARMAICQTLSRWLHALCSFQLSLSFTPADLLKWLILALLTFLPFSRMPLPGTQTIKEGLIGKSKPWEQSRKSEHCREPEFEGAFSYWYFLCHECTLFLKIEVPLWRIIVEFSLQVLPFLW